MTNENELYEKATKDMTAKARYKLANYMAHGYEISHSAEVTMLKRKDSYLAIDSSGDMWICEKAAAY